MSEEESPDLTKSWVFVDSEKKSTEDQTSGVEEVSENDNSEPHVDSDTDSISVISESGCSYKTDEEEFVPATTISEEESRVDEPPEITEIGPQEPAEIPKPAHENEAVEKLLYFATSAVCALILIGFSILVQHYFYSPSDVNKFAADFEQPLSPHVQSVKDVQVDNVLKKSYNFKRKNPPEIEETQIKMSKKQKVDVFHDRITSPSAQIENNDLTVETGDVKSNYKLSKNKSPATKFNKENCDDSDKRTRNEKKTQTNDVHESYKKYRKYEMSIPNEKHSQKDETLNKKMKELKMKEAYLKEKEKFLMEKEQDLMKKERKLNKEKSSYGKNKNEKKSKKDKASKDSSEEYDSKENNKIKPQKKYSNDKTNQKNNKKYKNKEDKKRYYEQNYKVLDDIQLKKRNISGQWYIDLHKARNNIRRKEHASDWVFDRAHLRSLKRNKAHWYFQWMVDRAKLRVK